MIDLHTHSIFSDGELIPAEMARRAKVAGCQAIAITDHGDHSNIDFIIPRLVKVCQILTETHEMIVIPGIELTHVPPSHIGGLASEARRLGAKIITVHGETIVEPVTPGTNLAALHADIDILAHPGLLSEEEAIFAARNDIFLEISARKGHSLTNGHVVRMAHQYQAALILNTDSHGPQDLINRDMAHKIASGAGMTVKEIEVMFGNAQALVRKALARETP